MNVLLDANALLALLLAEPAMERVLSLLREGGIAMTGANLAEVLIPVDLSLARRAGSLRAAHYHRAERRISLADAVLLGAARDGDQIATADKPVLAIAAELGIETIELPPSSG